MDSIRLNKWLQDKPGGLSLYREMRHAIALLLWLLVAGAGNGMSAAPIFAGVSSMETRPGRDASVQIIEFEADLPFQYQLLPLDENRVLLRLYNARLASQLLMPEGQVNLLARGALKQATLSRPQGAVGNSCTELLLTGVGLGAKKIQIVGGTPLNATTSMASVAMGTPIAVRSSPAAPAAKSSLALPASIQKYRRPLPADHQVVSPPMHATARHFSHLSSLQQSASHELTLPAHGMAAGQKTSAEKSPATTVVVASLATGTPAVRETAAARALVAIAPAGQKNKQPSSNGRASATSAVLSESMLAHPVSERPSALKPTHAPLLEKPADSGHSGALAQALPQAPLQTPLQTSVPTKRSPAMPIALPVAQPAVSSSRMLVPAASTVQTASPKVSSDIVQSPSGESEWMQALVPPEPTMPDSAPELAKVTASTAMEETVVSPGLPHYEGGAKPIQAFTTDEQGQVIQLRPKNMPIVHAQTPQPEMAAPNGYQGGYNVLFQADTAATLHAARNPTQRVNTLMTEALSHYRQAAYGQALANVQQALTLTNQNADLYAALAEIQLKMQQPEQARQAYAKAQALNSGKYGYRYAQVLALQGQRKQAVDILEGLYRQNSTPQRPKIAYMLGTLYEEMGWVNQALPFLQEAAVQEPTSADIQYNLGLAYELAGDRMQAETHYRQAMQLMPVAQEDVKQALARVQSH